MTRTDTLRLLLAAEVADNLPSVEATMRAITQRLDELDPDSDSYVAAHRRLDALIEQRERLRCVTGGDRDDGSSPLVADPPGGG